MKTLSILGAGKVGTGLVRHLRRAGYRVIISMTEDPAALVAAAQATGAEAMDAPAAITAADIVILALPWGIVVQTVQSHAGSLAGKVIWDCTNPLLPDLAGLAVGTTGSGGELVQAAAPDAQVVKGIPPFADILAQDDLTIAGHAPTVFLCGDDAASRETVGSVLVRIGLSAVDLGPLMAARYAEPTGMLLVQLAYRQGLGPRIVMPLLQA